MILLIFLLSFISGAYFKILPFLAPFLVVFLLIFLFKRFGKNIAIVSSLLVILGMLPLFGAKASPTKSLYQGIVIDTKTNYLLFKSGGQRFYIYSKNNSYEIGDFLSIQGNLEPLEISKIESGFDFEEYLNNKGVYYELSATKIETKFSVPIRIKQGREKFLSHFSDDASAFISGILFGQRDENEVNKFADKFHFGRFMSISGIYIYLFLSFFNFIFTIFFNDKWAELCSLGALSFLTIFTFPNFSAIRIMFLAILKWLNKYILKNKFSYLTILSFSAFIFIFFDFYVVYQESFILGYGVPLIFRISNQIFRERKQFERKIASNLLIYFFFIPFEIKYYNSINFFLVPLQYMFTPLFMLPAFTSMLCYYKIPLYTMVNRLINDLAAILKFFSFASVEIYAPPLNKYLFAVMIFVYLVFLYYLSIGFKPIYKWIAITATSIYLINFLPLKNFISEEVCFINVGQGDCCLIRNKTTSILIDTGGSLYTDIANDCLIPYFKKKRIYNIDLVITTHNDFDHSGAFKELKDNFHVKKYIDDYREFPISLGGINIDNYNTFSSSSNDDNESSLVLGFNLLHKDFLIMGDAPIKVEKQIMTNYENIPCDILKVGHHGSSTSTSDAFIKYLKPKEAIISVGRNYYGHPNQSVISTLKSNKVLIKRTDELGTISYFNYIFM